MSAVQRWYPPLLASGATEASPPSVACELPVDKPVPSRGVGAARNHQVCRELESKGVYYSEGGRQPVGHCRAEVNRERDQLSRCALNVY